MFNDTDNGQTQYCPMCEEWAEKYDELHNRHNQLCKDFRDMRKCYSENLKLSRWQEQQINKLAIAIEKISKILEVYFDDDNKAIREIEQIINEVQS